MGDGAWDCFSSLKRHGPARAILHPLSSIPHLPSSILQNLMLSDFLKLSPNITVLPIIHGSGDFAIEVRRVMLSQEFDCLAVPLPRSFQADVERAIEFLPGISAVVQEEPVDFSPEPWSDDDEQDALSLADETARAARTDGQEKGAQASRESTVGEAQDRPSVPRRL